MAPHYIQLQAHGIAENPKGKCHSSQNQLQLKCLTLSFKNKQTKKIGSLTKKKIPYSHLKNEITLNLLLLDTYSVG